MAFRRENLSALTYANGFTLWHYRTSDAADAVDTADYFKAAANTLRVGDFVLVNAGVGGTPAYGVMVVVNSANGVVDLSDLTPFATANAD